MDDTDKAIQDKITKIQGQKKLLAVRYVVAHQITDEEFQQQNKELDLRIQRLKDLQSENK